MNRKLSTLLLVPVALLGPGTLAGQAREQRADSLEAELRRLQARVDSLEQIVRRLAGEGRDTTAAGDELAALRAAARAAAQTGDTTAARAAEAPAAGQARNLNRLNPEISFTGDVRLQSDPDVASEDNATLREVEFSFQAALDPFASTKVFLSVEEGELDVEEAYLYWTGLPAHLRVDLGRLRQQTGELNRWHLHALPESEYPLVYRTYFGEEGLAGTGVRVFWLVPTGGSLGVQELTLEGVVGDNQVLFAEGNRPAVLGHLNNFFELSPSAYFQFGGTAMYGENPDVDLRTVLLGADFRFTWRPPSRAQYRSFTLRGEGYRLDQEFTGVGAAVFGGFIGAQLQLGRRWFVGARGDYVEPVDGGPATWAVSPHVTWWQSEWAYLRAEWQHERVPVDTGTRDGQNRLLLQVVWAVGPHKHETY